MEVEAKGFRIDLSRAQWFKSTRSGPNSDNCVEVAFVDEAIAVRDSKHPERTCADLHRGRVGRVRGRRQGRRVRPLNPGPAAGTAGPPAERGPAGRP